MAAAAIPLMVAFAAYQISETEQMKSDASSSMRKQKQENDKILADQEKINKTSADQKTLAAAQYQKRLKSMGNSPYTKNNTILTSPLGVGGSMGALAQPEKTVLGA